MRMTMPCRQSVRLIGRLAAAAPLVALCLATGTVSASAALSLDLPGNAQRTKVTYVCRASKEAAPVDMTVEYINLPGNTLALLPIDGKPTLFVDVVAGSGAQYVSGRTIWWTKGPGARLYDAVTKDFKAGSICEVKR